METTSDNKPGAGNAIRAARNAPLSMLSRVFAALLGVYGLTYAFTAFFSLALPLVRTEAVLTASLLSFLVYPAAVIGVFAARSALRAWLWTLGPATALAVGTWCLRRIG